MILLFNIPSPWNIVFMDTLQSSAKRSYCFKMGIVNPSTPGGEFVSTIMFAIELLGQWVVYDAPIFLGAVGFPAVFFSSDLEGG